METVGKVVVVTLSGAKSLEFNSDSSPAKIRRDQNDNS